MMKTHNRLASPEWRGDMLVELERSCINCLYFDGESRKCDSCVSVPGFPNFVPFNNSTGTELEETKAALDAACKRIGELTDQMEAITQTHKRSLQIIEEMRDEIRRLKGK
jgi:hypothetical protein